MTVHLTAGDSTAVTTTTYEVKLPDGTLYTPSPDVALRRAAKHGCAITIITEVRSTMSKAAVAKAVAHNKATTVQCDTGVVNEPPQPPPAQRRSRRAKQP